LITPLSCDIRHYFHSSCIEQWMKLKNECPLCKAEIRPKNLVEFKKELERMARQDAAERSEHLQV
jgi:endo-1,4-beta-mannosidase